MTTRERLALFLSKKTGREGRDRQRYPLEYFKRLAVYQLAGTVNWHTATPKAAR
jgi:hypothetical protein